jgi:hypothetical protein
MRVFVGTGQATARLRQGGRDHGGVPDARAERHRRGEDRHGVAEPGCELCRMTRNLADDLIWPKLNQSVRAVRGARSFLVLRLPW